MRVLMSFFRIIGISSFLAVCGGLIALSIICVITGVQFLITTLSKYTSWNISAFVVIFMLTGAIIGFVVGTDHEFADR